MSLVRGLGLLVRVRVGHSGPYIPSDGHFGGLIT